MKKLLIFTLLIFIVSGIFAQAPPPTPGDENVPLASNIIILLFAGISYTINIFYNLKKGKKFTTSS